MHAAKRFGLGMALMLVAGCSKTPPPAPGTISGSMWYENLLNEPMKIRGAPVSLLPLDVERSKVQPFLDELARKPYPHVAERLRKLDQRRNGSRDGVDEVLSAFFRSTAAMDEGMADPVKYKALLDEKVWSEVLPAIRLAYAESDIDGKYEFGDIKPGTYWLYSHRFAPDCIAVWFDKIEVKPGGRAIHNFHTGNAQIVQFKNPEPVPDFN